MSFIPPSITYDVTTLQHNSVRYAEAVFHERIKDDKFLENMQYFRRCMRDEMNPENNHYIDQTPCLIVKGVVPEEKFRDYEFYSLYSTISDSKLHRHDCFMVTYLNLAEPVPRDSVLFNNKMEMLLAPNKFQAAACTRMHNAQILRNGLAAPSFQLN